MGCTDENKFDPLGKKYQVVLKEIQFIEREISGCTHGQEFNPLGGKN